MPNVSYTHPLANIKMKPIIFIFTITVLLMGCQEKLVDNENSDGYATDTMRIGNGLRLEKPFKVEYDIPKKGSLDKGRILNGDKTIYSFRLNFNLVNDTIEPDKWILTDTVSTSLRKDTIVFNWYREQELDWITIKYIYTNASGVHSQYLIHGFSKSGNSKQEELTYLFSEMRRTALEDFFDHDSVLIRNIIEIK